MTSSLSSPTRRALTLGALGTAALSLAACGGGGSSPATTVDPTSYGGGLVPGSVLLTITHRVTMTVSMPDTTGVDWSTIDLDGFNALPLVSMTINVGLDAIHAPLSTQNFLAYLNSGAYKNTIFHRVIPSFVAQGGGYTDTDGTDTHIATNAAIGLESRNGITNSKGTLAMARTTDPNSATSEFFFNLVDNGYQRDPITGALVLDSTGAPTPILNYPGQDGTGGYAVFGTVLDQTSLDTLTAIAGEPTGTNGSASDWPIRDITVTAISID